MYQDVEITAKVCKQLDLLLNLAKTHKVTGVAYQTIMDPVSFDPYMEMPVDIEVEVIYTIDIDEDFLKREVQIVHQEITSEEVIDIFDSASMSSFLITDFENAVWDISSYCMVTADEAIEFDKYVVLQDLLRLE